MPPTWAVTQSITQLTSVVQTEQLSTELVLAASYRTEVTVIANSDQATPVDYLNVRVYMSINDGTNYDDEPWAEHRFLPDDTNDYRKTFFIPMCRSVKLGVESDGPTDTYVVDADYRRVTAL